MTKLIVRFAAILAAVVASSATTFSKAQTQHETDATPVVFYRPNPADFANAKGWCLAYISNRQSDGAYWKACFWSWNLHFFHIGKDVIYQHWAEDTPGSYIFDSGIHEEGK